MNATIQTTLSGLRLGPPELHANLAVFPLVASTAEAPDYLLLDQALKSGLARVSEITEAGHVPQLAFENGADRRVLLVDGEELVGARQNRVLNISILAPAARRLAIPVSCCEQGRWAYHGARDFAVSGSSLFSSSRAKMMAQVSASMAERGEARADQSEVWADIAQKSAAFSTRSGTGAMADVYRQAQGKLDDYAAAFNAQPGQVGAVMCVNGQAAGVELFDAPSTFARFFAKLVKSYALDALEFREPAAAIPAADAARTFIDRLLAASARSFAALGDGEDVRITGDGVIAGALLADGRVRHLAGFHLTGETSQWRSASHRASLMRSRSLARE